MFKPGEKNLLWWLIPGVLAGIGAVVSLLNNPSDGALYHAVGMDFLCLPIPDGYAPTFEQADAFVEFVEENRERNRAVAAHCYAGLGRTGTMLGVYLIAKGADSTKALLKVRAAEPAAIETRHQVLFLDAYAEHCRQK